MIVTPRGLMQVVTGGLPKSSSYLLLGSAVEGEQLVLIDDAATEDAAEEKAELFLEEHPDGGVLIVRHVSACYRLPLFPETKH